MRRSRRWLPPWLLSVALGILASCSTSAPPAATDWQAQRQQMVDRQLIARGIQDGRVLDAMRRVPRHEFVPEGVRAAAYEDRPLPIGQGQTISQPYIVGLMTELSKPHPGQRVLEVGTGSGYQAAVLAELVAEVYTIELIPELARQAQERLKQLGYENIEVRSGDGYQGWPEAAPFDAVVVTCGAQHVPEPLFEQLKPNGILVIPVGLSSGEQSLRVITRGPTGQRQERDVLPVRFVPLRRAGDVPGP
jgi:protein-L-isoaspartate(D-aspartate) O-methyltransferase